MPRTQPHPVGNEVKPSVIQFNLEELFQVAHNHPVKSSFPTANEGAPEDIVIVDTGSAVHICVKTSNGWFKSPAFTAV